eukprot:gene6334-6568_t
MRRFASSHRLLRTHWSWLDRCCFQGLSKDGGTDIYQAHGVCHLLETCQP